MPPKSVYNDYEIDLGFPMEGIDEERSFTRQRPGTTIDLQNCRAFEPATGRARGSQRPGTVKYFEAQAVTTLTTEGAESGTVYPIQEINHLVSTEIGPSVSYGRFTYGMPVDTGFGLAVGSTGVSAFSGLDAVSTYKFANSCYDDDGNAYVAQVVTGTGAVRISKVNSSGVTQWTQSALTCLATTNRNIAGMVVIGNYLFVALTTAAAPFVAGQDKCRITRLLKSTGAIDAATWRLSSTSGLFWSENSLNVLSKLGNTLVANAYYPGTGGIVMLLDHASATGNTYLNYLVHATESTATMARAKVCTDGSAYIYLIACCATSQIQKYNAALVLQWASTAVDPPQSIAYDRLTGTLMVAAGSGASVRTLNTTTGAQSGTGTAGSVVWDELDSDGQGSFVAWRNSQASNDVIGLTSAMATAWGPSTLGNALHVGASMDKGAAAVPPSAGARLIRPLVVAGGELRRFTEDGPVALTGGRSFNSTAHVVFGAQNGTNMFFADGVGYFYYKGSTNTVVVWTPTAGTLPVDSPVATCARLIETWNGRTMLLGFLGNPQLWAASKQFNPFNWSYTIDGTTTQATNGNVSPAGLVGDKINCFIPYSNDTGIFGCDHTIYQMTGDPMQGGRIDRIKGSVGMAWGRPWAIDTEGEQIYFVDDQGQIRKMQPGAMPTLVSQQIGRRLENIDMSAHIYRLVWDKFNKGLYVYITPTNRDAPTVNFYYEERVNAWQKDVNTKARHNPMAVHIIDADAPGDRKIFLGGGDGYVRVIDNDAATDDGFKINSYVWLGPFSTKQMDDMLLLELQATLGQDSGNVTWEIYVGDTVEEAYASDPVRSGTWTGGRGSVSPVHRSGFAIFVKLSAESPWAIERLKAFYRTLGPTARMQ